jgi:spermidine synthase
MTDERSARQSRLARGFLLTCFLLSGFTALLYQTVWLRLALARFGVNTPVVATVLAVFMLGLATGSVLAGRLIGALDRRFGLSPLRVYALAELVVGLGGVAVPALMTAGRAALLTAGPAGGALYTLSSSAVLTVILLPFCTAMGLTFPAAVAFLEHRGAAGKGRYPFSALYLANVIGALAGAVATPVVLIELFGFLATARGAAVINAAIAIAAFLSFRRAPGARNAPAPATTRVAAAAPQDAQSRARQLALFVTGFSTMGMEVVWMRVYPYVIGTFVYSFAAIIATYLLATTAGSAAYRRLRQRNVARNLWIWLPWLGAASLLPLYPPSVSFPPAPQFVRLFLGIAPFCALLGFLTPALIDREAGDDAARVGRAYGINLVGCLLGPIVAGFALLPVVGTRAAAVGLALPLFAVAFLPSTRPRGWAGWSTVGAAIAVGAAILSVTTLFEETFPSEQVRRDHVATVVADGEGMDKSLYVNGVGMTTLTPVTKLMAHFPAAHLAPRDGRTLDTLVICFGMGTTFRSLASWGANVTAVELVPSVPALFGYFHPDGPGMLRASGNRLRIVADDGRRFLDRSPGEFDLITIDPPPPVEAAGSSLLYSKEFYASAKRRLKPGGILQTWLPGGDRETIAGMALSALESFRYVRVFGSLDGSGFHVMASDGGLPRLSPQAMVSRMPAAAVADLTEWIDKPPAEIFARMLTNEYAVESLLIDHSRAATLALSDDHPVNEFYLLRGTAETLRQARASESTASPAAAAPR